MMKKTIMLALVAASALTLVACGPDSEAPGTGTSAGAGATNAAGGGSGDRDSCLIGTWNVDVNDMAQQAATKVPQSGNGTGTGTITLAFGDTMTITYDAVITITAALTGDQVMKFDATYKGAATSNDWTAKDGKIAGTMPIDNVTMKMAVSIGGQTVPMTNMPFQGAMDISEGALAYTCSGSAATLTSPAVVWHLTKA